MKPWMLIAGAAIAAYYFGKKAGIAQATSPAALTTTLPAAGSISPSATVQAPSAAQAGSAASQILATP